MNKKKSDKNFDDKTAIFNCVACVDCMHLAPKYTGLIHDIILSISGILKKNFLVCHSCVDRKKKDALLEHISSFRENTEVKRLKNEIGKIRTEIKDNIFSLITQIKEMKKA